MNTTVPWHDGELLGFDLETTGVDRFEDVPVSYALVRVVEGVVVDRDAGLIDPGRLIPEGATAIHGITTEQARSEGRPLDEIIGKLAETLCAASARRTPVVGMKLDYDLTMLDAQCRRVKGSGLAELGFDGPVLDVLVIDRRMEKYRKGSRKLVDLCDRYGVTIENAHDASADAEASIEVLRAMCSAYPELENLDPGALHTSQIDWHRTWATSFDEWLRKSGKTPLDPREFDWPIATTRPSPSAA